MYNIQDWIDEKIELDPIEATSNEWRKGSVEAAYEKGLLNERLKNEIKKKQEWTYDKAVELAFQYEKKKWEDIVANCDPNDLSKIVEDDIENLNRKLYSPLTQFDLDNPYFDNNAELISEIKKGIKYTKHIKGGEYKKVEAEYKKFKNNESFQKVNLEYEYNYYYVSYLLKFKEFLEETKEKNNKTKKGKRINNRAWGIFLWMAAKECKIGLDLDLKYSNHNKNYVNNQETRDRFDGKNLYTAFDIAIKIDEKIKNNELKIYDLKSDIDTLEDAVKLYKNYIKEPPNSRLVSKLYF